MLLPDHRRQGNASMKIGKGPTRFGGPSQAFLDRKGSQEKAAADAKASRIPREGEDRKSVV